MALTGRNGEILHQFANGYPNQFTDVSYGITTNPTPGYFLAPTPGADNPSVVSNNGPLVSAVTQNPGPLFDSGDFIVTARVETRDAPLERVDLIYRTMFGSESTVAMRDDGLGGDAVAGDGLYAGIIPESAAAPGEMLRWKVIARDVRTRSTSAAAGP